MKLLLVISVFISIGTLSNGHVIRKSDINGDKIQTIYSNINDFKEKNPGVKIIPMNVINNNFNLTRSYSLGTRQTGDVVVANSNKNNKWPSAQNVTTTLTYPSSGGNGAYLTFILINCEQSSNIGQAYVTYGGVHQHFIQIVVEAQITSIFNYAAFFYGIK